MVISRNSGTESSSLLKMPYVVNCILGLILDLHLVHDYYILDPYLVHDRSMCVSFNAQVSLFVSSCNLPSIQNTVKQSSRLLLAAMSSLRREDVNKCFC